MSESRLLRFVLQYPDATALARRVPDGQLFEALRRLEVRGLVTRRRGGYRLTLSGRNELALMNALARLLARAGRA